MLSIALPSDLYRYIVSPTLDGVAISIRLTWSDACGAWYADVLDAQGDSIVSGARVSGDSPLLSTTTAAGLPPGRLIVLGPDPYPRTALGQSLQLIYVTADEVAG